MNSKLDAVRTYLLGLEDSLRGMARVNVKEQSVHVRDPGLFVEIEPLNSKAAAIYVHVESANQVDIDIGVGSHAELYANEPTEVLEQLKEVIDAIIDGRFEETTWRRSGRIVRAKGTLDLGDTPRTFRYSSLGALLTFGRTERLDQRYEPYRSSSDSS